MSENGTTSQEDRNTRDKEIAASIVGMLKGRTPQETADILCAALGRLYAVDYSLTARIEYQRTAVYQV